MTMASGRTIRMLYWVREEFPTFRVDVDVLFGKELLSRGHQIDFVMQAQDRSVTPGPRPWRGRTVFVGKAAGGGLVGSIARHLLTFWHDLVSLRLARRGHYDAIQVRDKFLIAAIAVLVARSRGLKFFYWLSFPYPEGDRLRASSGEARVAWFVNLRGIVFAWLLYRWILPRAHHAFVQSERMKQNIAAQGIPLERMTPVPMGMDLTDMPSVTSAPLASRGEEVVIGYLGALDADRHIEMLVDTLAELRRTGVPARLLLIGSALNTADTEALQRHAQRQGVAAFLEMTGALPRLEALRRMRSAHIALSPCYPSPKFLVASMTKLVEYMALGLPVVASDHPEQTAILRETRCGLHAPWGSRHFARSVRWLLAQTPARLESMGTAGRAWVVQNRSYARIADDLELRYRGLLADSGS